MLDIELDPMEKNREGALRLRKAPVWRYGYLISVLALWLASLPLLLNRGWSPALTALIGGGVLIGIALIVGYLLSNKVSGFHSAGLSQIALSRGTRYQYDIRDGRVHRESDEGSAMWRPEQFVRSEIGQGEAILIFRTAVCYLPFRGAGRQSVIDFVNRVEQFVRER